MRRFRRQLIVGGVGVIAVLGALTSAGSGAAPACNLTQLQLRDSTVNQGLGSYDRIVRGKETLVRMYFSMPSCHDNNDSIQITGGTLSATGGGVSLADGVVGTPTPVNTFPTAATYAAAPVNDSTADVKFVVRGSDLARPATTDAYLASFSATITFRYKTTATGATTESSRTFTTFAAKTVEKRTNALRVLVVPMGNAANSYSSEFPAEAVAAVENGMQTLSRLFPVPDGVGTLGGTSGGIRYAIDSTLLNVTTPYCGSSANFDPIKAQLAQFLVSWNAANPLAPADRVMGAIWSGRSNGSTSTPACAEGMASLISPEGWVRAIPDVAGTPSTTGALFAMEIGHTFGLVPAARSFSTFHSLNTASDGTSPNRGYNIATRAFLSDDRSAMRLAGTWNNNTTLLEKEDYAFLVCVLGGQTKTECLTSGVAGTAGGVAALPQAFAVTGTTDDTPLGTSVEESFRAGNLPELGTDANSAYRLIQLGPGDVALQTDRVRVAFGATIHDDGGSPETESAEGTFAAVVPLSEAAVKFELRKGTGPGILLWSTLKTAPPVIGSFTTAAGGVRNFTNTSFQSEDEPALTSDAAWIAYTAGTGITVAPTNRPQSAVSIPFPVQNGSTGNVVYSETSKIHVVTDPTGTPTDTVVFDGTASGLVGPSDPEFSPDLTRIVFSAGNGAGNRDIYTVGRFGGTPRRLTTHADYDTKPTWTAKGRIVFVRGPQGGGPTTELYSVRPDGTGETRLTTDAFTDDEPTASPDGNDIAWQRVESGGWDIYRMSANGGTMTNLTSALAGNALSPDWSPNGTRIAFHLFFFPLGATDTDVYTMGADGGTPFNATPTTGKSETNPKWSGDGSALLYQTGSGFETVTFPFEGSPFVTPLSIAGASDWAVVRPSLDGPAWGGDAGDGAHLAFVSEGDLYVVDVDLTGAAPSFGDPRRLYNGGDAKQPTISKDDSKVIFVSASSGFTEFPYSDLLMNDLVTVDGNSSFLTDGGGPYRSPSLSRVAGGDVLAVEIPNVNSQPEIFSSPILLSDPSLNFSGRRLLTNASQPSWGTDGRLAFNRGGNIWVWTPVIDGPGTEEKLADVGSDPSLAGNTYAFERSVGTGEFPPSDIFIGSPGSGTSVNVQVTDDNAAANRLDLLADCGALVYVAAVALEPDEASGATASWTTNFDPSLTCENPILRVAVSDGYNRVVSSGEGVQAEQKPPTAAIYTPSIGSTFRQYELVPARGSGWDAEDGTLTDIDWQLTGPGAFSNTGTGGIVDFSPAAGGFPLGDYTLTLTVTDADGNTDSATRMFTVFGDADNDGLTTTAEEALTCLGIGFAVAEFGLPDDNPLNAFGDGDGDGIVNVDDPLPCTAASEYEAFIQFDPAEMSIGSNGVITARVTIPNRQATSVSTAYVKSINGIDVSANAQFDARQWNVARGTNLGQAKIERAPLSAFFTAHGISNQSVRIVIAGVGGNGTWTFEGVGTLMVR